jgi:hypothetical protein
MVRRLTIGLACSLLAMVAAVSCGDPYSSSPHSAPSPTAPTVVQQSAPTDVRVFCEQVQALDDNFMPIHDGNDYYACQAAAIYANGAILPLIDGVTWQSSNVQQASAYNWTLSVAIARNSGALITASFQGTRGSVTIHAD